MSNCTLSILWWAPDEGDWDHGWDDIAFPSENAAIKYCKDLLHGIEIAEIRESGARIVSDGKLVDPD